MVHFNELRITKNVLVIDVIVPSADYYKNVYLDTIDIDTMDTFVSSDKPSSKAVYHLDIPDKSPTPIKEDERGRKHFRLILDSKDLALKHFDEILFVYVTTKGEVNITDKYLPCCAMVKTTMQSVVDLYPFYQKAMNFIKELSEHCSIPQNFIDEILQIRALETAIKTGHYTEAIKLYKKFFKNKKGIKHIGGCGCGNR